jgi:energy-coupling factor transport system permease protein
MNNLSMYIARESGLHNLHPLTKSLLVLCLLAAGLALPGRWTSYIIFIIFIVPLAVWGKIFRELIRAVSKITWPLALSVLIIQSLFWGKGTPIFEFWRIAPKEEGILFAFISIGRIILTMSDFILFAMTTRPDMLMISLKQVGMPSGLAYIVVTTLQIIPSFQMKAATILDAQRSRGLETEGNIIVRSRALVPLVLPLVLGSLMDVEERAIAIQARAFGAKSKETSLIENPDTSVQKLFRRILIILIPTIILFTVLWQLFK